MILVSPSSVVLFEREMYGNSELSTDRQRDKREREIESFLFAVPHNMFPCDNTCVSDYILSFSSSLLPHNTLSIAARH